MRVKIQLNVLQVLQNLLASALVLLFIIFKKTGRFFQEKKKRSRDQGAGSREQGT
jgi:hypothetical protein